MPIPFPDLTHKNECTTLHISNCPLPHQTTARDGAERHKMAQNGTKNRPLGKTRCPLFANSRHRHHPAMPPNFTITTEMPQNATPCHKFTGNAWDSRSLTPTRLDHSGVLSPRPKRVPGVPLESPDRPSCKLLSCRENEEKGPRSPVQMTVDVTRLRGYVSCRQSSSTCSKRRWSSRMVSSGIGRRFATRSIFDFR